MKNKYNPKHLIKKQRHMKNRYESKHDGDDIDLDLCCDCFDKILDKIIPLCKHNPITEGVL